MKFKCKLKVSLQSLILSRVIFAKRIGVDDSTLSAIVQSYKTSF